MDHIFLFPFSPSPILPFSHSPACPFFIHLSGSTSSKCPVAPIIRTLLRPQARLSLVRERAHHSSPWTSTEPSGSKVFSTEAIEPINSSSPSAAFRCLNHVATTTSASTTPTPIDTKGEKGEWEKGRRGELIQLLGFYLFPFLPFSPSPIPLRLFAPCFYLVPISTCR